MSPQMCDVTTDAEWWKKWYIADILPAMKSICGKTHRCATGWVHPPQTCKGNPEVLSEAGGVGGWLQLVEQPAQSPDFKSMAWSSYVNEIQGLGIPTHLTRALSGVYGG
ncbi:unnamed protein product [Discosporangium mesarthrocarpum]